MTRKLTKIILALGLVLIISTSCKEEETPLAQILAGFSSTSLGLTLEDTEGTVALEISRTDAAATTITLTITEQMGTVYGVDYSTVPEAVSGVISMEIAAGETSADLVVNKLKNPEFEEVKGFSVEITEVSNGGDAGTNSTLTVTFEENPVSSGAEINAEVGGPEQPNQVFIDLSKQTTTEVDKDSWDLAFNTGSENRVLMNYGTYTMAKSSGESELGAVTDAILTDEFKADITPLNVNIEYMDDPAGDITKSAIAEVSATEADNHVYVINRGYLDTESDNERGFMKFKVTLDGDNYVITYGEMNDDANFTSVTIQKNPDYNFTFFSFVDGVVDVEPTKGDWDFSMTTFLNEYYNFQDGLIYSYKFKDYSLTNKGNVKISSVAIDGMVTYEDFSFTDIAGLTLEDNRTGIGSSWRGLDFNTFQYFVKDDIFYVIEDTDGNYYKLKFTDMFNESGDRGYPKFVYELLTE